MNLNINIGLGSIIALIVFGIVIGAFFAGKISINIPEKFYEDLKMYIGILFSILSLVYVFYTLYFRYKRKFGESWAISYLVFVLIITLFMNLNFIPNPMIHTGLVNRITGKPLVVYYSQVLWASVSVKLLLVGVSEL